MQPAEESGAVYSALTNSKDPPNIYAQIDMKQQMELTGSGGVYAALTNPRDPESIYTQVDTKLHSFFI